MNNGYDCIIIGGGPAGLSAGIYALRAKLKTILIEKLLPGGQVLLTDQIENYPGFGKAISGADLISSMTEQVKFLGLEILTDEATEVKRIHKDDNRFALKTDSSGEFGTLSLIAASGAYWNRLNVPGEEKLIGKGVSYCATCDGPLAKKKDVVVVGGGDKAVEEAIFLTKFANKVTLVHRREKLRAANILQDRLSANPKIGVVWNSVITEVLGQKFVEAVKIKDVKTNKITEFKCGALFVFIGISPNSAIFKDMVDMDEKGFIITDNDMKTSQDGIFACGDVRKKSLYQIVTAVGEGATAAFSAQKYVEEIKGTVY